jgi:hypothetical protein
VLISGLLADEAAVDDELDRGARDAHRGPEHPEPAGIGEGGGVDLDLAVDFDVAQLCVYLYRDVFPCGVQMSGDLERVALMRRAV